MANFILKRRLCSNNGGFIVYLLYNRPRWAYRFFCCIGLLKFTNDVYFGVRVRRDRQANVYPTSRVPDHLLWLFTSVISLCCDSALLTGIKMISGPELMLHTVLFGFAMQAGRVSNQLRTPVTTRLRANGSEVLVMTLRMFTLFDCLRNILT